MKLHGPMKDRMRMRTYHCVVNMSHNDNAITVECYINGFVTLYILSSDDRPSVTFASCVNHVSCVSFRLSEAFTKFFQ